ncbi:hypothetical protein [Pelobacter seleniigenes]|uniref:hypothetical protein n=1 Tax=Pelobacter seleniigenes TaxID=407188 RepID=UPI0012B712FB|nr:hypothetical protein [Pelobacter seleniigenes]
MTHKIHKILSALFSAIVGTFIGSFFSALMGYIHYPDEVKSLGTFCQRGIEAFIFSPFSMTIGIFPTIGFYGWIHGATAMFGMVLALISLKCYFMASKQWILYLIFAGFALWANNNYLSWAAMMSV